MVHPCNLPHCCWEHALRVSLGAMSAKNKLSHYMFSLECTKHRREPLLKWVCLTPCTCSRKTLQHWASSVLSESGQELCGSGQHA